MSRKRDELGASAVEYGLIIAGIAAIIVIAAFTLGGPTVGMYKNACDQWVNQQTPGSSCT